MTKKTNIKERNVTKRSEIRTMNILSLEFQDIREWVILWRLILRSLGCTQPISYLLWRITRLYMNLARSWLNRLQLVNLRGRLKGMPHTFKNVDFESEFGNISWGKRMLGLTCASVRGSWFQVWSLFNWAESSVPNSVPRWAVSQDFKTTSLYDWSWKRTVLTKKRGTNLESQPLKIRHMSRLGIFFFTKLAGKEELYIYFQTPVVWKLTFCGFQSNVCGLPFPSLQGQGRKGDPDILIESTAGPQTLASAGFLFEDEHTAGRSHVQGYDRGKPAVGYRWTGWVWEITSWSSRLEENYRSF